MTIDNNTDSETSYEPTVEDHLIALGYNEVWIRELANMIVEFTHNDPAIAASRATDLATHPRFGKAVAYIAKGYLTLCEELDDQTDLSPNQRETMRQVLLGMLKRVLKYFPETNVDFH